MAAPLLVRDSSQSTLRRLSHGREYGTVQQIPSRVILLFGDESGRLLEGRKRRLKVVSHDEAPAPREEIVGAPR